MSESGTQRRSPLVGRRIVVTRAAEQARSLVERLAGLGAEPLCVPLIMIAAPSDGGAAMDAELERLGEYDWVVVSSPNGAERVRPALHRLQREAEHPTRGTVPRIAVVGQATEHALGVGADLVPRVQTAVALGEAFPTGPGSVLVVQPEGHDGVLVSALESKGWTVTPVAAYRTIPVSPSSTMLLDVLSADAVLFASGSAVRSWVTVFGAEVPAVTVAIGPSTAALANKLGLKIDAVATDHSVDGLVGCLMAYFLDSV